MTFDVAQILSGPMEFGRWSGRDHSGLLGDKASSTPCKGSFVMSNCHT